MTTFERIKNLAKSQKMTLAQLNEKAGLGTNSIYHWRTKTPSTDSLAKVATVLNVSVDYLLGNTDDPSRDKTDVAAQVGGLFRSVTDQEDLTEDEQNDIKRDIEILLETRAKSLRRKRGKS